MDYIYFLRDRKTGKYLSNETDWRFDKKPMFSTVPRRIICYGTLVEMGQFINNIKLSTNFSSIEEFDVIYMPREIYNESREIL